jgi:hypothetical protein
MTSLSLIKWYAAYAREQTNPSIQRLKAPIAAVGWGVCITKPLTEPAVYGFIYSVGD